MSIFSFFLLHINFTYIITWLIVDCFVSDPWFISLWCSNWCSWWWLLFHLCRVVWCEEGGVGWSGVEWLISLRGWVVCVGGWSGWYYFYKNINVSIITIITIINSMSRCSWWGYSFFGSGLYFCSYFHIRWRRVGLCGYSGMIVI